MRRQGLKWIGAFAAPIFIFRGHRFPIRLRAALGEAAMLRALKRAIAAALSALDRHSAVATIKVPRRAGEARGDEYGKAAR